MTTADEPWTIGRLLSWTIDYLGRHGAENPRLDSEVLLAHARGCRRIGIREDDDRVSVRKGSILGVGSGAAATVHERISPPGAKARWENRVSEGARDQRTGAQRGIELEKVADGRVPAARGRSAAREAAGVARERPAHLRVSYGAIRHRLIDEVMPRVPHAERTGDVLEHVVVVALPGEPLDQLSENDVAAVAIETRGAGLELERVSGEE